MDRRPDASPKWLTLPQYLLSCLEETGRWHSRLRDIPGEQGRLVAGVRQPPSDRRRNPAGGGTCPICRLCATDRGGNAVSHDAHGAMESTIETFMNTHSARRGHPHTTSVKAIEFMLRRANVRRVGAIFPPLIGETINDEARGSRCHCSVHDDDLAGPSHADCNRQTDLSVQRRDTRGKWLRRWLALESCAPPLCS
jgi:hypothetical protein